MLADKKEHTWNDSKEIFRTSRPSLTYRSILIYPAGHKDKQPSRGEASASDIWDEIYLGIFVAVRV